MRAIHIHDLELAHDISELYAGLLRGKRLTASDHAFRCTAGAKVNYVRMMRKCEELAELNGDMTPQRHVKEVSWVKDHGRSITTTLDRYERSSAFMAAD